MNQNVRVGVGVFIIKNGKFLMGRRLNAHGDKTWSIPGGKVEYGETLKDTAIREAFEETGIKIKNIRFGAVTNDRFKEDNKHSVTIWMLSDWQSGIEKIKEPDKFTDLEWKDFDSLPKPLFLPWSNLLKSEFIDNIKKEVANLS